MFSFAFCPLPRNANCKPGRVPFIAKFLIAGGVLLIIGGVLFAASARLFPSGVPGDIAFKRGGSAFYFLVVSSIVLSIVATIVLNIVLRLFR